VEKAVFLMKRPMHPHESPAAIGFPVSKSDLSDNRRDDR